MPDDPHDHQEPCADPDGLPSEDVMDDDDGRTTCGLLEED